MVATPASVEAYIATLPPEDRAVARHVLLGHFNARGRPVGFHHAPDGVAPPGRRIDQVLERYPDGTYRARVSFWDPGRGWVRKPGTHSMFPDHWSAAEVMNAGRHAYRERVNRRMLYWRGRARDVPIAGYRRMDGAGPATFFPDLPRFTR